MPENAAAEGGFGRDAPSRSDENDRGGQREKEEAKAKDTFDRAMDNANRPDRAPAAPSDTTAVSDDDNEDDRNTTDKIDDRQDRVAGPPGIGAPPSSASPNDADKKTDDTDDRGILDRVADTLTAPPTDAEGNARSTSPVADRVRNHTQNYSLSDLRNAFTDDPGLTPEQSRALEEGAAVMEEVTVVPATYAKPTAPAPLSPLQSAAALADAELYVGAQVYQREAETRIGKIDERITNIDEQLHQSSPMGPGATLDLYDERNSLTLEREQLTNNVANTEATFEAIRGGGPPIGLSPEVLEKVVADRTELADRINPLQAELDAKDVTEITDLTRTAELRDLQIQSANRLSLGLSYQEVLDQEAKLAEGETITVSAKHPYEDFVVERLVDGVLSLSPAAKGVGTAVKWGSKAIDNAPTTSGPQLTINRRDDGLYEVMQLTEPFTNAPSNGVFESREVHYEFRPDGRVTVTKEVFNPVPGNPLPGERDRVVRDLNRPADDFDLEDVTHGRAAFIDGEIRISPAVRDAFERPITVDSSPP